MSDSEKKLSGKKPLQVVSITDIDKADLVSDLSHEVRTLLGGIIGINELLLASELSKHQRKLSETIDHSSKALLDVLNEIVDLYRADAGRLKFDTAPLDLRKVCEEAIAHNRTLKRVSPPVEFELSIDTIPPLVLGDMIRLRQALNIFITNGLNLVPAGKAKLCVSSTNNNSDAHIKFQFHGPAPGETELARLATICGEGNQSRKYDSRWLSLNLCATLFRLMRGSTGLELLPDSFELWAELSMPQPQLS